MVNITAANLSAAGLPSLPADKPTGYLELVKTCVRKLTAYFASELMHSQCCLIKAKRIPHDSSVSLSNEHH